MLSRRFFNALGQLLSEASFSFLHLQTAFQVGLFFEKAGRDDGSCRRKIYGANALAGVNAKCFDEFRK